MSAMNLYRRCSFQATLALLLLAITAIPVVRAQRRSQHKLRATALLELTTDSKGVKTARLTPITILDEGTFHDASIYKAAPQPMALESGVVYEAEKSGETVGFVTVARATKERIWMGLGKWQAESDRPKPKVSATPAASASDERPRLRRPGSSTEPQSTPTPSPSSSGSPQSSGSDDRPVLRRPASDTSAQATPSPSPSSPTAAATPAATPEEQTASVDPNRPTLRRGKPTPTPSQPESVPQPAKSSASSSPTPSATKTGQPAGSPAPGTQLMVAVSDAEPGDSRSFKFMWKPGEEAPIAAKLRHQAAERLAQEEGGRAGAAVIERELKNVVIRSFDLDLTNDAILVLTAELPPGSAPQAARPAGRTKAGTKARGSTPSPTPAARSGTRYITLITRVDLDGNPQILAANLTDSSRLDIAPRLELVDAVDVDGDGIGELLFREYDFDNQSFVIYGVRHGAVTKLFEGASQALR
jgi:hypothetical protein